MTIQGSHDKKLHETLAIKNYDEWGKPSGLSLNQYLEREVLLLNTEFSKESHELWTYTVDGQIVSACESYKSKCIAIIGGKYIEGDCFRIGSVFTPSEHRKKGYASQMMKELLIALRSRDLCVASVLYSDVGPDFYARCGWRTMESKSLKISNRRAPFMERKAVMVSLPNLKPFIELEENQLSLEIKSQKDDAFVIVPTYNNTEWFHVRSRFYAELKFPSKMLENCGAMIGKDWISWWQDFNDQKLVVLNMRASNQDSVELLLNAALEEAENWQFGVVEIWDPSTIVIAAGTRVAEHIELIDRDQSLSCVAFWGPDKKPANPNWFRNEKYAWC